MVGSQNVLINGYYQQLASGSMQQKKAIAEMKARIVLGSTFQGQYGKGTSKVRTSNRRIIVEKRSKEDRKSQR